jgi:hypothetical protein
MKRGREVILTLLSAVELRRSRLFWLAVEHWHRLDPWERDHVVEHATEIDPFVTAFECYDEAMNVAEGKLTPSAYYFFSEWHEPRGPSGLA